MMYLPVARRGASGYSGSAVRMDGSNGLGDVVLSRVAAPRGAVAGESAYVDPGNSLIVAFVSRGAVRPSFGHRNSTVTAGRMAMNDMSRASGFQVTPDFRSLSIRFSPQLLNLSTADTDALSNAVVPLNDGIPLVLCAMAAQLMKLPHPLSESAGAAMVSSMTSLVTAFTDEFLGRLTAPDVAKRNVVSEASRYIDLNLSDPSLAPASIASALRISIRSLHLAFEGEPSSVSRTILQRRLERCRDDLESLGLRHLDIETIAAEWGFATASHFSRAFKTTYGVTPREWRMGASHALAGAKK